MSWRVRPRRYTFPLELQVGYRIRDALCVRLHCGCFMKNVKTWVNGKRKTWSMDCSDTRVGEWKLAVPILRRSQINNPDFEISSIDRKKHKIEGYDMFQLEFLQDFVVAFISVVLCQQNDFWWGPFFSSTLFQKLQMKATKLHTMTNKHGVYTGRGLQPTKPANQNFKNTYF